ncbi:hypothetical protein [Cyanothece sp. BG0011]|uniref:hypothetical protein n=1 Tax=Cyanothece sp. BG0011 TaxID=2082950 RepID=UPI000D1F64A5|nr:hypothetical protein [Cyanothece sp. BG0011]
MQTISTQKYLNHHGVKQDDLRVNKTEEQQISATDQNLERLKAIDFEQKKLALVNEQIKTVLLILSIFLQVVKIVPVMVPVAVSNTEHDKNVEVSTIKLHDDHIKKQ